MKALLWTGERKLETTEIERPEIKDGEILVKVELTGICGSDIHAYLDKHRFRRAPAVLGHEVVGTVEAVGEQVSTVSVGDYISVNPQVACGECELCEAGHENLCRNKLVPGTKAWHGTFAQYFTAPEHTVIQLPQDLPVNAGVLIEPIAVAVHAVKRVPTVQDKKVTVMGAGPIGHLIAVTARHYGANSVVCVDVDPVALKAANENGFGAIDPRKRKPDPADIVFLTAGYPQSVNDALKATKPRGCLVVVSMYEGEIPIDIYHTVFHEIDILGSMTYVHEDYADAVEVAKANPDVASIVSEPVSLANASAAFNDIVGGRRSALKVLLDPYA